MPPNWDNNCGSSSIFLWTATLVFLDSDDDDDDDGGGREMERGERVVYHG